MLRTDKNWIIAVSGNIWTEISGQSTVTSIHLIIASHPILQRGEAITDKDKGEPMICHKCGVGHMVDDSHHDIRVFKCCICGDRIYPDHPKRSGALVCSRCDGDMDEKNALSLCKDCLSLLNIYAERLKGRSYGQTVCICGTTFTKTSPTQLFHSKECRNRAMTVQAEQKKGANRPRLYYEGVLVE